MGLFLPAHASHSSTTLGTASLRCHTADIWPAYWVTHEQFKAEILYEPYWLCATRRLQVKVLQLSIYGH